MRIATCIALVALSIGSAPQIAHAAAYNSSTGNGTINCSTSGNVTASNFKLVYGGMSFCVGNLVIPSGITEIGHFSVYNVTGSLSIPASVTTIDESAFYLNKATSFSVNVLNTNFLVGADGALYNASKSRLIAYPAASSLTTFEVPATVSEIDQYAFNGAAVLQNLSFAPGGLITSIKDQSFEDMAALTSVTFHEGLLSIGAAVFRNCRYLGQISFPSSLTTIDRESFRGSWYLFNVTIPASVTSIGAYSFSGSNELSRIIFLGNAPTSFEGAFVNPGQYVIPRAVLTPGATGFDSNIDGDNDATKWYGLTVTPSRSITFNSNSADSGSTPANVTTVFGSSNNIPGNTGNLEKTNFIFAGWNTNPMGTGTGYAAGSNYTATENNLVLYAKWFYDAYSVTYFGNGNSSGSVPVDYGSVPADNSNARIYNTTVPVLSNANSLLKTGYVLTSWNTSANGSGTSYSISGTDSFTMPRAAVNLYAKWQINSYTISYDPNGAESGTPPSNATANYSSSVSLPSNSGSLTRSGYRFSGWNTQADGAGTNYSASQSLTIGTSNVSLYARWKQLPVTPSLSASNTNLSISLSWPAPTIGTEFITGFKVQRKLGAGTWADLGTYGSNVTSATEVLSGSQNSAVLYRIATVYDTGQTDWSSEASLAIPTIPLAVTSVNATGDSTKITIDWTAHANASTTGSVSFTIEATTDGLTWISISPSRFPTATSAVFDAAISGVNYRFRIKVVNAIAESTWSATSNSIQLTSPSTPPTAPPGNTTVIINTPEVVINTPAVTVYAPTVSVGAKLSATSLATGLGVAIPSKAKTTVAIAKSSKKFCKVSGGKVVGIKSGPCVATVTVQAPKPKKGKKPVPVKKSVTVQIS